MIHAVTDKGDACHLVQWSGAGEAREQKSRLGHEASGRRTGCRTGPAGASWEQAFPHRSLLYIWRRCRATMRGRRGWGSLCENCVWGTAGRVWGIRSALVALIKGVAESSDNKLRYAEFEAEATRSTRKLTPFVLCCASPGRGGLEKHRHDHSPQCLGLDLAMCERAGPLQIE